MISHPLIIVPVEPLVAAVHSFELFVGEVTLKRDPGNHEMVRAQDLRDSFNHIGIQPADRRPNRHHRRHANDDANQSQKRAQLVRKDRLQSDL